MKINKKMYYFKENSDYTIIFMEYDLAKARNMELVLFLFEKLFVLKINFNKSELFCFGRAKEEQD